jgi:hypothetical protein
MSIRQPAPHALHEAINWPAIGRLRIAFGHQSVGHGIVRGIARLAELDKAKINIHEQRTTAIPYGINHFSIGRNGDPMSKIIDFTAILDDLYGHDPCADIALLKLCYADFKPDTDARLVADVYIGRLASLARRHPGTQIIAMTAPVTALQRGPKAWLKAALSHLPGVSFGDAKRAEFNTRLREHYCTSATAAFFDLARTESAIPESTDEYCMTRRNGDEVEALNADLSSDGGHLNERGENHVAAALLGYISTLAESPAARCAA